MICSVRSLGLTGVSGYQVTAECFISNGLPAFEIVGLPDAAVKESRERVRAAVEAYQSRISGPLLDRIDLIVEVPAVQYEDLRRKDPAEASETIRQRVNAARDRQHQRFQQATVQCNARMSPAQTQLFCTLDDGCARLMKAAFQSMGLTARSYDRILRVARTIADLDGSAEIQPQHLAEAIQYRTSNLGA